MNETAIARGKSNPERPDELIIDCDVHPVLKGGLPELYPYMPEAWRQRFELKTSSMHRSALTMRFEHPSGSAVRADARTPDGGTGGSDPKYIESHLLDQHGISYAVLTSLQAGAQACVLSGPDESIVITSAFNDLFLDKWGLEKAGRLRLAMTVPTQDPAAAVAEIRRIGGKKGVAAVFMPLIDILMGNRYYHPIYAEAEKQGLPILVHVTGTDTIYRGVPTSSGWPENYSERYVSLAQIGEANLTSLVFSGTFEKFPKLKFVFVEFGFSGPCPCSGAWTAPGKACATTRRG